ncbi:MAG: hypothetical protein EWM47_02860 [Anaerolineaceae bacterium]|nr:MAG: hypothetical protein EWM47_02860 [Anaerolineaceae bacterium]
MKKGFKTILTVLFAAVFFMSFIPARAEAAPDNTAYLAYADSAWNYQYWGDPVENGVVGTDAEITGPGQYTVSVDFTGTADGKATAGLEFAAVIIAKGSESFPGYFIQYDSIVLNGEAIEFAKNYTSSDDGVELRSNIYNHWVGSLPDDARRPDGDLTDATPTIVDPELFTEVETLSVTFTVLDADGNAGASSTPKTGVASMALVYGLGALITGAYVFKKKEK